MLLPVLGKRIRTCCLLKNYRAGCKKKLKATKEAEGRSKMKAAIQGLAFNEVAKNLNFDQDDNVRR